MRIQHIVLTSFSLALFAGVAVLSATRFAPAPIDLMSTVMVTVLAWAVVSYGLLRSLRGLDPCGEAR